MTIKEKFISIRFNAIYAKAPCIHVVWLICPH